MSSITRLSLALVMVVLAAAPASAGAQERIDGQYIVVLKSNATVTKASERARSRGGRVLRKYSHALKGYTAKLSKQALSAVEADPSVAFVEPDRRVSIDGTQANATWGLDRLDQRALPL